MKIENNKLISIEENDLINGHFCNSDITKIGDCCFYNMNTLIAIDCPNVTKCGDCCFRENESLTTINTPLLSECGDCCFRENESLTIINIPSLIECDNFCFRYNDSLTTINTPLLSECGDCCFRENESLTTINTPLLSECGDFCFYNNDKLTTINTPLLSECGDCCFRHNDSLTTLVINEKLEVMNVDGYCFVIKSKKMLDGNEIYYGYNFTLDKKEMCYVVKKDNFTAHGVSIKSALNDVLYKIYTDKLQNEPIYADTKINIEHFRAITGACSLGVEQWRKENNVSVSEMKASELLILLRKTNAYGLDKIEKLIAF